MANPIEKHVGRIVSYQLYKQTPEGPLLTTCGSMGIDTTYKGDDRSARDLLAYITKAAFDEAAKNPGFVEVHGDAPEDFFTVITHQFVV